MPKALRTVLTPCSLGWQPLVRGLRCREDCAVAEESSAIADELVITVYLDTNALLDLLATVEDGFSLVERVTSGQTSDTASDRSGTVGFAAPGVLNFFKLGLSGKLGRSTKEATSGATESELTHTYGSLLHRLRRYLFEENLVTTITPDGDVTAAVGTFVEFTGVVRPNPFTATFRQLQRMLTYVNVAVAMQGKQQARQSSTKSGRGGAQARPADTNPQAFQLKAINDFFEQLTSDVEREGTGTILLESQESEYRAIVTLYDEFLRDRSMAELLNREFRVLGKIARHLPKGSAEKVDLIASSGIAGFPPELLAELLKAVDQMSIGGQLAAPSTIIPPPVIEIVPIAIYL